LDSSRRATYACGARVSETHAELAENGLPPFGILPFLSVRQASPRSRIELVNPDGSDGTPRERPKRATPHGAETDDDDLAVRVLLR
jgi:hypothetical protein